MKRRDFLRTAGGAAGAVAASTAASGSATAAAEEGTTHTVEMTDGLAFEPESITVAPGDTVVWENVGQAGHSVTAYEDDIPEDADYWASGGFDSEQAARDGYEFDGDISTGNVAGGESWEHTFETTGTHEYFCKPHEAGGMVGEVVVTDDPGAVTPGPTATPEGTGTPMGNATATEASGGGGSVEVAVGPGSNFVFDPDSLTIPPGTTVTFSWKSNNHNVVPDSQPAGANWQGEGEPGVTFDSGHSYSHTFDTTGTYEYVCTPHESAGMVASLTVEEGATLPGEGGEGGGAPSIPDGAKAIGVATTVGMVTTLGLAFTLLKYGGGQSEE